MILRGVLLVLGGASLAFGLAALALGALSPFLIFAGWGVLLLVGILYERIRYKPVESGPPGGGWQRTPERFIDDETGKPVTVYVDAASGERRYVQE